MTAVGRSARRYEGAEKLTGRARYVDDVPLPGCLHGVTLRSPVSRGIVREIAFDPTFAWDEFVVCTAKDIPGQNAVTLLTADQPLLADGRIAHAFEPVALVAHPIRQRAWDALGHIHLDIEELPGVLTLDDALARTHVIHGQDNVLKSIVIEKGDVPEGLRHADLIVEGEYDVPLQEQAYIENNGMAAWWEDGALTLVGSLQCPYYVLKAMQPMFGLPPEKVRVIQAVTGGGFGGKEEYPNMISGHAALLALKARRPVKIVYDRTEDMQATTKRHPGRIRHRTGVMRDGRLVAQDIEVQLDGGAYTTLTPVVLSRAALHATGPYECPNVRVRATALATNTPPNGAFRGFGAPQSLFAAELHWERIAQATGIDSLTLRRRNVIREGSVLATGQVLRESVGAAPVLQRAVTRSGYTRKRRQYDAWNRDPRQSTWRGVGLALVHHGGGFTGSGEDHLQSRAAVTLTRDGSVVVRAASTEIGQGTSTIFAQIAADALGVPSDWITVERPDTAKVPDSGPTVASRTCMIVGGLVERAGRTARQQLEEAAGGHHPRTRAELRAAARRLCGAEPVRSFEAVYERPPGIQWDDQTYRGDAYGCYSFACAVVDLEVDRLTYEIRVRSVTAAADIGRVVNPVLAQGQVCGGLTQGLGYALSENVVVRDGRMANPTLTDYIIPTALDVPPLHVEFVEVPYSRGPGGAKGVGELPIDVPAPAVAAAVLHATGRLLSRLPLLPERLFEALAVPLPARAPRGSQLGRGTRGRAHAVIRFVVNGKRRVFKGPAFKRLIDVLREDLGLTGTKEGCGEGECGACTVLVDGRPVNSCLVPVCQVQGAEVETVESLGVPEHLNPLQEAFLVEGGAQCGICTPGMLMTAWAYVRDGGSAKPEAIRNQLAGNLCRCTGYQHIVAAVVRTVLILPKHRRRGGKAMEAADGARVKARGAGPSHGAVRAGGTSRPQATGRVGQKGRATARRGKK